MMPKRNLGAACLFAICATSTTAPAQDKAANAKSDDVFFATVLEMNKAQMAKSAPMEAILAKYNFAGTAGIEQPKLTNIWNYKRSGPKNRSLDIWRWASVTKQIVAVLVMQEVEAGRIELDQPVSHYLPAFKSANATKITVRQLLRHQSGLPNPDDTASAPDQMATYYLPAYKGNRSPLSGYCAGPPKSVPGGSWSYNNCDYIVAGALLEAVTGKAWGKLVTERITKPLGLHSLTTNPAGGLVAKGTIKGSPEPKIEFSAFGSAANLHGTASDLLVFDQALMSGKLLGEKARNEMWDGKPELGYMALGQWAFDAQLKDCPKPMKLIERRGSIGGVQVRNFLVPERQAAIVVFSEKSESDFDFGEIWQGSGFSHDLLSAALCTKTVSQP